MLSTVEDAAPEGAEREAFLGKPCNHMARLIRDLCAPESVQENLKNVLTFIKNVSTPFASSCLDIPQPCWKVYSESNISFACLFCTLLAAHACA